MTPPGVGPTVTFCFSWLSVALIMEMELSVLLDTTTYLASPDPCTRTSKLWLPAPVTTRGMSRRSVNAAGVAVSVDESNANRRSFFVAAAALAPPLQPEYRTAFRPVRT